MKFCIFKAYILYVCGDRMNCDAISRFMYVEIMHRNR